MSLRFALPGVLTGLIVIFLVTPPYLDRPLVLGTPSATTYLLPVRGTTGRVSWDLEMTVLNLLNQERVAAGLQPLMPHATMRVAARAHARDMFKFGYLSHRSRDGRTPQDRVLRLGVHVRLVGENLAYAPDVITAHRALVASRGHRENLLYPRYDLVGIGVVYSGPHVVVVQNFGDGPPPPVSASP